MALRQSFKVGLSFGLTSGIITTLGLIVGLHSGTHSQLVIIGSILVIAIADSLSDSLGIHISEEAHRKNTGKEIWESTLATFFSKLIITLTFIIPILFFSLKIAIIVSVLWGLFLIGIFSFFVATQQKKSPFLVVSEHLVITILVIVATHYIGDWVATLR
jgi:VIT1/CCC1 family predicted Fe2+/Mn2+ transporter